jgi:DNA-directed RNA polymerase specialized sigma24 family protein
MLALRSTIKDMGRSISHRAMIVEQWLKGKEYSEISRNTHHSVAAVKNYIQKFKRVVGLA